MRSAQAPLSNMDTPELTRGLTRTQRMVKRIFDIVFASVGLLCTGWLIGIAYLLASLDTKKSGFFLQQRIGKNGRAFRIIKIRTMQECSAIHTTITSASDARITPLGRLLRKAKIDELPQLINVLKGDMSFVGPRPDVPGYADRLDGEDRIILSVRPGITGPATVRFRHEERLLSLQADPVRYNDAVIWPEKVRLNRAYVERYRFVCDLYWIIASLAPARKHQGFPDL